MTSVAIVIVTYNGKKYLSDLLSSLEDQRLDNLKVEIIIVDNNSTDGTVEYLKNNYQNIKIFENQDNLGFAKGNNLGIKYALDNNFTYIALLNQDIVVNDNWLIPLVDRLDRFEKIGAIQPRIMYWPETKKINSYGNILHYLGFGYTSFNGIEEKKVVNYPREINYASGAAVLIRSKILRQTGLFDESFFMYHEDTDLSLKIKFLGYSIELEPKSKVYHHYEFSKGRLKFFYIERNRIALLLKFYKIPTLILLLPAFLLSEVSLLARSIINGFFFDKIKSYLYYFLPRTIIHLLKERREIQKNRKITDKELLNEMSGKIEFQEVQSIILNLVINPVLNIYKKLITFLIVW